MKILPNYRRSFICWRNKTPRDILEGVHMRNLAIAKLTALLDGKKPLVTKLKQRVMNNPCDDLVLTMSLIIGRKFSQTELGIIFSRVYKKSMTKFDWSCHEDEGLSWFTELLSKIVIDECKESEKRGEVCEDILTTFTTIFCGNCVPFVTRVRIIFFAVESRSFQFSEIFSTKSDLGLIPDNIIGWFNYYCRKKPNHIIP